MIKISADDIREQLRDWNIRRLDVLEEVIGRELTDDEFTDIIIFLIGYADFDSSETLQDFVSFLNLEEHLSKEEMEAVKAADEAGVEDEEDE